MEEFVVNINELALDMGLSSTYGIVDEDDHDLLEEQRTFRRSRQANRLAEILTEMKDDGITRIKREHLESGKYTGGGKRQRKELRPTTHMSESERMAYAKEYSPFNQQSLVAEETTRRIEEKRQIEADKAMKKAEKRMGIGPSRKQRILAGLGTAKEGISKRVGYGG